MKTAMLAYKPGEISKLFTPQLEAEVVPVGEEVYKPQKKKKKKKESDNNEEEEKQLDDGDNDDTTKKKKKKMPKEQVEEDAPKKKKKDEEDENTNKIKSLRLQAIRRRDGEIDDDDKNIKAENEAAITKKHKEKYLPENDPRAPRTVFIGNLKVEPDKKVMFPSGSL